jgi:hypothetical protein
LAKINGLSVYPLLLNPILERLRVYPAIEYVSCLQVLLTVIPVKEIHSVINPIILELSGMSESHQHAAAHLILALPLEIFDFSSDQFISILNSQVIFREYLPQLLPVVIQHLGKNWGETVLPRHLLAISQVDPTLREGACRGILSIIREVDAQQLYVFMRSAIGWAATSEPIALAIIEHADNLIGYKNGCFQAKIRDLGVKLTQTTSVSVLLKLFSVFSANPVTFLTSETYLGRALKLLTESPEVVVRCSFIDSFHHFYTKTPSKEFKDRLFSWLLPLFSSGDHLIAESLLRNREIYHVIGPARISAILPAFLRITQELSRWRSVASAISTFSELPLDAMRPFWPHMWPIMVAHFRDSPSALKPSMLLFIAAGSKVCPVREFVSRLLTDLRNSHFFTLRRFYIDAVLEVLLLLPVGALEELWPDVVSLVEDPVPSVRAALLQSLAKFRKLFAGLTLTEPEHHLFGVIALLSHDQDPYVKIVWKQVSEHSLEEKASATPIAPAKNARSALMLSAPSQFDRKHRRTSSMGRPVPLIKTPSLSDIENFRKRAEQVEAISHLPIIQTRPRLRIG